MLTAEVNHFSSQISLAENVNMLCYTQSRPGSFAEGQGQSSIWNGTRVAYAGGASAQADWDMVHVEESLLKCLNIGLPRQRQVGTPKLKLPYVYIHLDRSLKFYNPVKDLPEFKRVVFSGLPPPLQNISPAVGHCQTGSSPHQRCLSSYRGRPLEDVWLGWEMFVKHWPSASEYIRHSIVRMTGTGRSE